MGKMVCKECSKWTSTVTFFCEHCGARLYSEREMKALFTVVVIVAAVWEIGFALVFILYGVPALMRQMRRWLCQD